MSRRFEKVLPRTLEARLAGVALALGILALFGTPDKGETVTVNPRELATMVETEVDHVDVQELADWIIRGRAEVRLLDLRAPDDYAEYHIPGAENVSITSLIDYPLYRNEEIVLYSNGGIHSAQAWFLLQAYGFRGSYILLGGLQAWRDEILFPSAPTHASATELGEFRRATAVSAHFGGSPRTASADDVTAAPVQMPKIAPPAASPVAPRGKRKAKEGC